MIDLAAIRKRPGMFVGGTDGAGLAWLVLEVLANAYDQYIAGRCTKIHVEIAADGSIAITDNGPGISVEGANGVPPLAALLETYSNQPTVDGHRPHVHLGSGGVGLFVVNALSELLTVSTVRDGLQTTTAYARGVVVDAVRSVPTTLPSGTSVRFRPDPTIFPHLSVPRAELTRVLEDLSFLTPRLTLSWSMTNDDVMQAGLVGLVALQAGCAYDAVASHRESYPTDNGPVDVDVALTWERTFPGFQQPPAIKSYVNLGRTRSDGCHVDGLLDGVSAFLGGRRRKVDSTWLVAAVSVVLADVTYGEPTKDRLDSVHARAPVAAATKAALDAWATSHGPEVETLRARRTKR